jgi:hypothetical protein
LTPANQGGDRLLAGKCLCDAVHYAVADQFVYAANRHCSNCRRATGSAFKPFAGIARDRLRITEGEDSLMFFADADANDTHCKACGSLLYSAVRDGRFVHGDSGRRSDHPPGQTHLRRLQGAVIHHYGRPAAISGACGGRLMKNGGFAP